MWVKPLQRATAMRDRASLARMTIARTLARPLLALALPALVLAGCSPQDRASPPTETADTPQDAFFTALASHCGPDGKGRAYAGKLVSNDEADADFASAQMVMHVRECSDEQIAVPFHIELDGEWDRSRTWLISRTGTGLRLKHDHRHKDGKPDAVTMYGGDTASEGTPRAQDFAVDGYSVEMFRKEGLAASVTNVWTVEVDPDGTDNARFAYQLQRTVEGGAPEPRFFRVEFDLTAPVEPPPAAWGHE